ncbi:MAG: sigma-54 dependent transcriptional regulator [Vicinamibacteraceae bacterium]
MLVQWLGIEPPSALRQTLRGANVVLAGGADAPAVVLTAAGRTPPRPTRRGDAAGPWLWLSRGPMSFTSARAAVAAGAYDAWSLQEPEAEARLLARLHELAAPEDDPPDTPGIVAASPAARAMLRQVWRVARTHMPVLLVGETGTGKEEMAALVHRWSARSGPYVPVNCAAIPNELMESELFGHARGAFSGAVASVDGKLMVARGGSVFLDEIDDTPLSTQVKLLRVLEDGQVTRLGETTAQRVDFRIVAATNRDLETLIAEGRFGQDLYERLAIVTVHLPRLRERAEDIAALARHFIGRFYARAGLAPTVTTVSAGALEAMRSHPWPGNIRELRNVIYEALVYKRAGSELLLSDLVGLIRPSAAASPGGIVNRSALASAVGSAGFELAREVSGLERAALEIALKRTSGNAAQAARLLGSVGRGQASDPGGTVRAMMKRLGIAR